MYVCRIMAENDDKIPEVQTMKERPEKQENDITEDDYEDEDEDDRTEDDYEDEEDTIDDKTEYDLQGKLPFQLYQMSQQLYVCSISFVIKVYLQL